MSEVAALPQAGNVVSLRTSRQAVVKKSDGQIEEASPNDCQCVCDLFSHADVTHFRFAGQPAKGSFLTFCKATGGRYV